MSLVPAVIETEVPPTIEGEFTEQPEEQGGGIPQAPTGDEPLTIEFLATLAGVNTSARPLNFDIDGAAKISLETDESQTPYVIALMALKRNRLIVSVRVDDSVTGQPPVTPKKRGRKKKATQEAD